MDPYVETFLYGEIGIEPRWFPWKVEALVAAGVLSETDGEWWMARAAELSEPGPPAPESVREHVAAMDLDRDTMIELHRAGVIDDAALLEVAEREGPIW